MTVAGGPQIKRWNAQCFSTVRMAAGFSPLLSPLFALQPQRPVKVDSGPLPALLPVY